jgi:hypothetical protein
MGRLVEAVAVVAMAVTGTREGGGGGQHLLACLSVCLSSCLQVGVVVRWRAV